MARRVGFGGKHAPNKRDKDLRDKYHVADGNHSDRAHTKPSNSTAKSTDKPENRRARIFVVGFLGLWLLSWGAGIILSFVTILTDFEPFLLVWLAVAVPIWVGAAFILVKLAKGKSRG